MTLLGFLLLLLIAAVCGAMGQALVGYRMGGFLVSTVVGLIGAFLGNWLARTLGLPMLLVIEIDGRPFPLVWSIIGAIVFVAIISLLIGGQPNIRRR